MISLSGSGVATAPPSGCLEMGVRVEELAGSSKVWAIALVPMGTAAGLALDIAAPRRFSNTSRHCTGFHRHIAGCSSSYLFADLVRSVWLDYAPFERHCTSFSACFECPLRRNMAPERTGKSVFLGNIPYSE